MKKGMCQDSALLKPPKRRSYAEDRLVKYKAFAAAFSYPGEDLFNFFPDYKSEKDELTLAYDRLFRSSEVWLYSLEHMAANEFDKARLLSDIMGFYKAFGLEPDKERPDALFCELEFMHYLILKEIKAPAQEKAIICFDAQMKFFREHLYPGAKKIIEKILQEVKNGFYLVVCEELLKFLDSEERFFKKKAIK